jgi:hypothetical protein
MISGKPAKRKSCCRCGVLIGNFYSAAVAHRFFDFPLATEKTRLALRQNGFSYFSTRSTAFLLDLSLAARAVVALASRSLQ